MPHELLALIIGACFIVAGDWFHSVVMMALGGLIVAAWWLYDVLSRHNPYDD